MKHYRHSVPKNFDQHCKKECGSAAGTRLPRQDWLLNLAQFTPATATSPGLARPGTWYTVGGLVLRTHRDCHDLAGGQNEKRLPNLDTIHTDRRIYGPGQ